MDVEMLGLEDLEVEFVVLDLVLSELGVCGGGQDRSGDDGEGEREAARGDPPDIAPGKWRAFTKGITAAGAGSMTAPVPTLRKHLSRGPV